MKMTTGHLTQEIKRFLDNPHLPYWVRLKFQIQCPKRWKRNERKDYLRSKRKNYLKNTRRL